MLFVLKKMLSGEGEESVSSKRVITFLAFTLMAVGFLAELFLDRHLSHETFDAISYIVISGLGFTASEKFVKKEKIK
jgi:hypothetical protein